MLEISFKENKWNPPELDKEVLTSQGIEYIQGKNSLARGDSFPYCDAFIIVRFWPYIDSVFVPEGALAAMDPESMKRFVFHDDYCWDYEDEMLFEEHILNNPQCSYSYDCLDGIYEYYSKQHPDWNLQRYYTNDLRLLDHIYHCMRKDTAKEILYKSGLDELAVNFRMMDMIELLSTEPSDLYEGINYEILKNINCREGAILLSKHCYREYLKELIDYYPEIFEKEMNNAQCKYLKRFIDKGIPVEDAGRLYKKREKALRHIWSETMYRDFIRGEAGKDFDI